MGENEMSETVKSMTSMEYYGSMEGMPEDILNMKSKKLSIEFELIKKEIRRRDEFTDTEKLADRLHRLLHFAMDCDYYYSHWPSPNGCRTKFLNIAQQLQRHFDYAADPLRAKDYTLGAMVRILEIARFGESE